MLARARISTTVPTRTRRAPWPQRSSTTVYWRRVPRHCATIVVRISGPHRLPTRTGLTGQDEHEVTARPPARHIPGRRAPCSTGPWNSARRLYRGTQARDVADDAGAQGRRERSSRCADSIGLHHVELSTGCPHAGVGAVGGACRTGRCGPSRPPRADLLTAGTVSGRATVQAVPGPALRLALHRLHSQSEPALVRGPTCAATGRGPASTTAAPGPVIRPTS
jgi:hypothetical protein